MSDQDRPQEMQPQADGAQEDLANEEAVLAAQAASLAETKKRRKE